MPGPQNKQFAALWDYDRVDCLNTGCKHVAEYACLRGKLRILFLKQQTIAEEVGVSANASAACQLQPMEMQSEAPEQRDCLAVTAADCERPGQLLSLKSAYNHDAMAVTVTDTNYAIIYNHRPQSHNKLSLKDPLRSALLTSKTLAHKMHCSLRSCSRSGCAIPDAAVESLQMTQ